MNIVLFRSLAIRNWHYVAGNDNDLQNLATDTPFPPSHGLHIVEAFLKNPLKSYPPQDRVTEGEEAMLDEMPPGTLGTSPVPQAKMERANIYFYFISIQLKKPNRDTHSPVIGAQMLRHHHPPAQAGRNPKSPTPPPVRQDPVRTYIYYLQHPPTNSTLF